MDQQNQLMVRNQWQPQEWIPQDQGKVWRLDDGQLFTANQTEGFVVRQLGEEFSSRLQVFGDRVASEMFIRPTYDETRDFTQQRIEETGVLILDKVENRLITVSDETAVLVSETVQQMYNNCGRDFQRFGEMMNAQLGERSQALSSDFKGDISAVRSTLAQTNAALSQVKEEANQNAQRVANEAASRAEQRTAMALETNAQQQQATIVEGLQQIDNGLVTVSLDVQQTASRLAKANAETVRNLDATEVVVEKVRNDTAALKQTTTHKFQGLETAQTDLKQEFRELAKTIRTLASQMKALEEENNRLASQMKARDEENNRQMKARDEENNRQMKAREEEHKKMLREISLKLDRTTTAATASMNTIQTEQDAVILLVRVKVLRFLC